MPNAAVTVSLAFALALSVSSCGSSKAPNSVASSRNGAAQSQNDASAAMFPDVAVPAGPCGAVVKQGAVTGKLQNTTCEYLGIPYAKPPINDLRFMPPQPPDAWTGVRDATAFGAQCSQASLGIAGFGGSTKTDEDCLFINVYTPKDAPSKPLPVMAFIHGGAFTTGAGSQYDGELLSQKGPAVLVTMNYRLGALGFFTIPALDSERPNAPSGNDGIRDQALALQWVKDNIAAFHGDPSNVSVFGESAGSVSASIHLVSPISRALASRFIMESGVLLSVGLGTATKDAAQKLSQSLVDGLCSGSGDALACLRALPASRVASWAPAMDAGGSPLGAGWTACIEGGNGAVLPDTGEQLLTSGQFNKDATVLVGSNKNEWGLFISLGSLLGGSPLLSSANTIAQFDQSVQQYFGSRASGVEAHYAPATDADANDTYVRLMTDYIIRCPTRKLARLATANGTAKLYLYSYEFGRAYHSDELAAVFGPSGSGGSTSIGALLGGTPPPASLVDAVQGYWTRFAATGDPNGASAPAWPAYETATDQHMILADPPKAGSNLSKSDCDFWDSQGKSP
jgi:para-nitrobenzyl esterase